MEAGNLLARMVGRGWTEARGEGKGRGGNSTSTSPSRSQPWAGGPLPLRRHGDRLMVLYGRGIATIGVAPRGALL